MAEERKEAVDPVQKAKAQAIAGRRALRTQDGTELLEMLEERWGRRLPGKTADQMQANAGAMEVITLLRRLRESKEG